jgi:hypothetical protein
MNTVATPSNQADEISEGQIRSNYRLAPLTEPGLRAEEHAWPAEAEFILSAIETARGVAIDRRAAGRMEFRARASLQLYSDQPGDQPSMLCTRDATTRGIGFIARRRLPLGHGGHLRLRGPNGEDLNIPCTVRRCQETVNGWYEGSISFNREQWAFDRENTKDAD